MMRMMKMELKNEDRRFLMEYLKVLNSLQNSSVKVNAEINDVVATIHGSLNLDNKKKAKSLSGMPTDKLYEELAKRNEFEKFEGDILSVLINRRSSFGETIKEEMINVNNILVKRK